MVTECRTLKLEILGPNLIQITLFSETDMLDMKSCLTVSQTRVVNGRSGRVYWTGIILSREQMSLAINSCSRNWDKLWHCCAMT